MRAQPFYYFLILSGILTFGAWACNNSSSEGAEEASTAQADTTAAVTHTYTLTPFSESAQFSDASIEKMTFKNGKFDFTLGGTSYKLGEQTSDAPQKMCANSGEGQHIHLIVDTEPYAAKYTSSFDYQIPDGAHYVLAFLSRSYHESIKTDKAHKAVKANVTNNAFTSVEPVSGPMLFYSRPKGTYVGKEQTDKVMLDFYLVNVQLGEDYKVKVEINAEQTMMLDKWEPYYIEGLPMGDNKIKLTLVNKEGNAVDVPNNPVERVFTLQADPVE
ncbi:MAG: phosphopeptide-binding protein [Saprospirales bacterium]|nr:phosphopeptide-binding protein [Saprospirales bacterium]MBK8491979.1 phosphopeptide-binding protein [Saprospirales bacterium]